jgi:uncharacterized protein DUF4082
MYDRSMRLLELGLCLVVAGCGEVKTPNTQDAPGGPRDAPGSTDDAPVDGVAMIPGNPALMIVATAPTIGLCATGSFGWHFIANQSIKVVALSVWDAPPQGLIDSHEVALFDLSGAVLARGTVTTNNPAAGGFHRVSINPVPLTAGQTYVIADANPGQAHTTTPGTCSDVYGDDDNTPGAITVPNVITYKGVASEDTTNAPNPTALVFPNQFPPPPSPPFAFRVGASFEWVP